MAIVLLGAAYCRDGPAGFVVAAQPPGATPDGAAHKPSRPPALNRTMRPTKGDRATADEFVKAFNAADAKAVGALWAADAEYTDESGQSSTAARRSRKCTPNCSRNIRGATMAVTIESIRFLGPDIAVEKGIARLTSPAGEKSAARYTVVHARRDGKWFMVDCRDAPYVPGSNEDYLKDLEWLIGQWTADAKDEPRRITFRMDVRKELHQEQLYRHQGRQDDAERWPDHRLESQAGEDRLAALRRKRRLRQRRVDQGRIEMGDRGTGVFRDGSESTAVNIVTPIDANSFTWQSVKRTLDGVRLPDTPPVKIVRVQSGK